jgi:Ser/Thr protein kinase RdoA (MazF antagonist)
MSEYFDELTPDKVLHAVERGGFQPTGHCSALTCLENRVYDLRLEGGAHIVVKFYRPERWSREAILEEHRFLADLRGAEITVCAPLPFSDGATLHEIEGIFYAVWRRTGGRSPDELGEPELAILGRLLARIPTSAPLRRRRTARGSTHDQRARAAASRAAAFAPECSGATARRWRRPPRSTTPERGGPGAQDPRRLPPRKPAARRRGLVLSRLRRFRHGARRPGHLDAGLRAGCRGRASAS